MSENSRSVFVPIAVFSKCEEGYAVGMELCRRVDDQYHPFHIFSLWLPKAEYPSQKQVLYHLFAKTAKHLPEDTEIIHFRSTSPYFAHSNKEMIRKAGVFLGDRERHFTRLKKSPGWAVSLALDAVKRRNSIEERLI
ncbi:hypothetical protein ACFRCQ_18160 [Cytobacillus firmus]|uniref:hypothetical protein n=1 Tax=Cytobacillus firmus TaxID=1399 RepID=UPI003677159F